MSGKLLLSLLAIFIAVPAQAYEMGQPVRIGVTAHVYSEDDGEAVWVEGLAQQCYNDPSSNGLCVELVYGRSE